MAPLRLAFLTTASMMTRSQSAVEEGRSSNSNKVVCVGKDMTPSSSEAVGIKAMDSSSGNENEAMSMTASSSSMGSNTAASTPIHSNVVAQGEESGPIHFCFIVHGHQGRPSDLSYLHHAIKEKATQHGGFTTTKSSEKCIVGRNNSSAYSNDDDMASEGNDGNRANQDEEIIQTTSSAVEEIITANNSKISSTIIVHNAVCNEGNTHDGVEKGGERLANEMLEVIRDEIGQRRRRRRRTQTNNENRLDVTISIVGNSLGGLYGRYAVAKLDELLIVPDENGKKDDAPHYILDDTIRLHFNVFCSTASPHLGCADRTYFPIPRFAEVGIANRLGETGRDLFRVNDLMKTMATSPKYIRPLALFRKRIAYANAYGTDFVVPGSTAAFLDDSSDSLHYFDADFESSNEEDTQSKQQVSDRVCPATEQGLFVATCYTPRQSMDDPLESSGNELETMSKNLDSLGWTKVFVDIRKEIPISAKVPLVSNSSLDACPIRRLSSNCKAATSKDLCSAISSGRGGRISFPFGHNAICAFERGSFSTAFNKGGRPVMDSLAINLIDDISMWTQNV
jgi:hypothetical protein